MADYIRDSKTVVQNLKDAGCSEEVVEEFMGLAEAGEKQRQFKLLEKQRRTLLDKVHHSEKQIDCLDYLVFQMKKTQEK
ncbi:hypothetical protein [Clostridium transplantifaecale]|uniref:hypothetical protein n=1 Tax=Clostridium transplantifaecale TaxID=2479838 RepID=UPI000F635595|nr:hypothetical protein [Clostridium transplantifaecale]